MRPTKTKVVSNDGEIATMVCVCGPQSVILSVRRADCLVVGGTTTTVTRERFLAEYPVGNLSDVSLQIPAGEEA
jgi:hypothetical protein